MKILTVVGARPQFVKAAVVSRVLRADSAFDETLLHTGQHYDDAMSEVFFRELDIPQPDFNLGIGSGGHGAQTGRMLEGIEAVLQEVSPDCVLVYGDTNSTMAGALAAAKLHIPVAHVEAGLRSFNRRMPEEINRIVTDHVSTVLFAPTDTAVANLRREGFADERVSLVGDVMYDAAAFYLDASVPDSRVLERHGLTPGDFVLATIHRAENVDDASRLERICDGLEKLSRRTTVVFPVHPRTRKALEAGGRIPVSGNQRLRFIEPVGYLDMLALESSAQCIVTDSGGVQKEAFFCRVPCVTLRDETEWTELVDLGWNRLLSPTRGEELDDVVQDWQQHAPKRKPPDNLFGGRHAADHIREVLGNMM